MSAARMASFVTNLLEEEKDNLSFLTHRIIRARYETSVCNGKPLDANSRSQLREIVELQLLYAFKAQSQGVEQKNDDTNIAKVSDSKKAEADSNTDFYNTTKNTDDLKSSENSASKTSDGHDEEQKAKEGNSSVMKPNDGHSKVTEETVCVNKALQCVFVDNNMTLLEPGQSEILLSQKSGLTSSQISSANTVDKICASAVSQKSKLVAPRNSSANTVSQDLEISNLSARQGATSTEAENSTNTASQETSRQQSEAAASKKSTSAEKCKVAFNPEIVNKGNEGLFMWVESFNPNPESSSEFTDGAEIDMPLKQGGRKRQLLIDSLSDTESPRKRQNSGDRVSHTALAVRSEKADDCIEKEPLDDNQQKQPNSDNSLSATDVKRFQVACIIVMDTDVEFEFMSTTQRNANRSQLQSTFEKSVSSRQKHRQSTLQACHVSDIESSSISLSGEESAEISSRTKQLGKSNLKQKAVKHGTYKNKATANNGKKKFKQLAQLEKLARMCRILPIGRQYTLFYQDCYSEKQRIRKLRQLFEQAGFEGRPTIAKVEKFNLWKETAELNTDNIILPTKSSRRHRADKPTAAASWKRQSHSQSDCYECLKDVIDSESSD